MKKVQKLRATSALLLKKKFERKKRKGDTRPTPTPIAIIIRGPDNFTNGVPA